MNIPKDSFMLLSVINMRLRDQYSNFDELCKSEGLDKEAITKQLADAGFTYIPEQNAFR